jgi:hypothetical protein
LVEVVIHASAIARLTKSHVVLIVKSSNCISLM